MVRLLFSVFFLVFFCFSCTVRAYEELRVVAPTALKANFPNDGLIHEVPALFGVPAYREARSGILVVSDPVDGCSAINTANWPKPKSPDSPPVSVILLIKRGTCSFVTKVRNAQTAGAISAIVYNDVANAPFLPFMQDDGTGRNVQIPSVLISFEDATTILKFIGDNQGARILISLLYLLPRPDNRVEWDLFTSSWDPQTLEFKEEMIPVIQTLDEQQLFTPHYMIISGDGIGCTASDLPCGKQCTHQGKYCAMDPERNMNTGIDGRDVILQDLREYCVNKWINATNHKEGKNQYIWFQFVSDFVRGCYDVNHPDKWRTDDCAHLIMDKLKIDKQWITNCIAETGGADSTDTNVKNTALEQFLTDRVDYGVISMPYSYVNLAPYRGSYTCPDPIRNDGTCGVVEAICQGFATQPAACTTDKSCAFGVAMDSCGICGGDGKSCIGCDGVVNSGKIYDACGVCGGDGKCQQLSTGQIVGIVFASLFSVGLLSIGVYLYMKRQNKKMREDIDSLLKQYLPLEGGVNQGTGTHQPSGRLVDVNDSDM